MNVRGGKVSESFPNSTIFFLFIKPDLDVICKGHIQAYECNGCSNVDEHASKCGWQITLPHTNVNALKRMSSRDLHHLKSPQITDSTNYTPFTLGMGSIYSQWQSIGFAQSIKLCLSRHTNLPFLHLKLLHFWET